MNSGATKYKEPDRAKELIGLISQLKNDLDLNKSSLMHYITVNNLNITEKDIDELAEKSFAENQNGDIDVKVTIDKHIANINRQINSCENSIADNIINMNGIDREEPIASTEEQKTSNSKEQETSTKTQETSTKEQETFTSEQKQSEQQQTQYSSSSHQQSLVPQKDLKWYQFIQRFKNWRAEKKYKKEEMIKSQKVEDLKESFRKKEDLEKLRQLIKEKPELEKPLKAVLEVGKNIKDIEEKGEKADKLAASIFSLGGVVAVSGSVLPAIPIGMFTIAYCAHSIYSSYIQRQNKKRYEINKKPLLEYIQDNNLVIRERFIDDLAKSKFIGKESGSLDHISQIISQEILEIDKKIKDQQKDLGIESENENFSQKEDKQHQKTRSDNFRDTIRYNSNEKEGDKNKSQATRGATREVRKEKNGEEMER